MKQILALWVLRILDIVPLKKGFIFLSSGLYFGGNCNCFILEWLISPEDYTISCVKMHYIQLNQF